MAFPPHIKNEIHRAKEAAEAALPYDPTVATKAIVPPPPSEYQKTVVWDKNPWDRFDRKTVLAYTGNQDRIAKLLPEFARVGLNDVNIHWNFDNRWIKEILFANIDLKVNKKPVILNNAFGHYAIIKTSYELGCASCLIMEDDIRFLRDVSLIRKILNDLPDNYDVAMLDSFVHGREGNGISIGKNATKYWHSFRHDDRATSAACYALSREGMERFISFYESPCSRDPLLPSDFYFDPPHTKGLKMYFSPVRVARQTSVCNSTTNTDYAGWSHLYDDFGCPRRNYGK